MIIGGAKVETKKWTPQYFLEVSSFESSLLIFWGLFDNFRGAYTEGV